MDIMLERILSLIPRKEDGKFVHGALKTFANSIGLKSGNLVSDWMNGRSTSYEGYIYQIADIYNVSVEWLKGESDIKEKAALNYESGVGPNMQKLLDEIKPLDENQSLELLKIIESIKRIKRGE